MPKNRRVLLLATCAALVAACGYWLSGLPAPEAPKSLIEGAPPERPALSVPQSAQPKAALIPAPPAPTSPQANEILDLVPQAEAGDRRAACALGTRLLACRFSSFYPDERLDQLAREEARAERRGDIAGANHVATQLLHGRTLRRNCDGLPDELRWRSLEFLRQSALAGETESIIRYATGQALGNQEAVGMYAFLRTPEFETWRGEAWPMIEALQASGHPEAVLVILQATRTESHLAMVMPGDPVRDAAYSLLARRLFGEHEALRRFTLPPDLTPEGAQEAARLAETWHGTQFGNRRFDLENHLTGLDHPLAIEGTSRWPRPRHTTPPCFDTIGPGMTR